MKALPVGISVFANVALIATLLFRPTLAPPAVRNFFSRHESAGDKPAAGPRAKPRVASGRTRLWDALKPSDDLPGLVSRLRAAGFPARIIRDIVNAELEARFGPRMRALQEGDPNTPFWKLPPNIYSQGDKRLEAMNQLSRERSKLARELMSDGLFKGDAEVSAAQRRQFGNLSSEKIDPASRVEADYGEMASAITSGTNGILLPEDREKLAYLAREKRADLAAILSPEELAEYEMRTSPLTRMLGRQLGNFEATDAEFRSLFQAYNAFSDKFPGGMSGNIDFQQRQAAQQDLMSQIKVTLGEERYAEYARETNRDFQQLDRLAQQENLSRDTVIKAFNYRDVVARDSNQIFDDSTLTNDQKRTALQALAQNARTQLTAMLGPVVGTAYVQTANQWLRNVENGGAVNFTNGSLGMSGSTANGVSIVIPSGGSTPTYRRLPGPPPVR